MEEFGVDEVCLFFSLLLAYYTHLDASALSFTFIGSGDPNTNQILKKCVLPVDGFGRTNGGCIDSISGVG